MLTLLKKIFKKYLYRQYLNNLDNKCLALKAQVVIAFCMNPKVEGFDSPSGRDIFFHKNIRSSADNEYCCPCTVNISNVNFTLKI